MTAYTDFHYSPTGSGVISGAQVLEQTEQGINGLGQYVQDNVSGAIDTANQALTIAQTADSNATLALNTANSFASAISAANNTANNALTTAQSAQSTANSASSLATTANNNANTALNAANTATANVGTLTNSVNALGNRMTTAENAISTNAGNITTLQTNLQTTNNNVTTAMNNASTAVATAQSAQQTATAAKNAAYVVRYTGTTITDGGTIAYTDIDNTDNIKAGDKIIDVTGNIYRIASVDLVNETVTVDASDIIHLAADSDVVHKSGNETVGGDKTFSNTLLSTNATVIRTQYNNIELGELPATDKSIGTYATNDKNNDSLGYFRHFYKTDGTNTFQLFVRNKFANGAPSTTGTYEYALFSVGLNPDKSPFSTLKGNFLPNNTSTYTLGSSSYKWKSIYSDSYYYGTTAWGLDKANTWTGVNTFDNYSFTSSGYGFVGQGNRISYILPEFASGYSGLSIVTPDFNKSVKIGAWTTDANTGKIILNQSGAYLNISAGILDDVNTITITPRNATSSNIGDSNNKWKTLNGINPGALSLPDLSSGTGVSLSAGANSYSPPSSGWLSINLTGAISVVCGDFCHSGTDMISVPVVKGSTYTVTVATSGTAYLFVSQGNV